MFEMVSHELSPDCSQGLVDRCDLRHDVSAVTVFIHHLLKPADLPLDPPQALLITLLDVRVHSCGFSAGLHLTVVPFTT